MLKTAQTTLTEGVINLAVGHPSLPMLPLREMEQAAAHRFAQGDAEFLQYGFEWGDGFLRTELAAFLTREYSLNQEDGLPVQAEDLFISGGVSQALDLICAMLTEPGDTIIVEDPTYFFASGIFRNHRLNIRTAPVDGHGLNVDALEKLVQQHRPKLVYTIPTHQNPSGVTLSEERREKLVQLAQQHDFYIMADEVYHLLTFDGTPPRSFSAWVAAQGEGGRVLSLGSFSKILAPGTRLGWIHAPSALLERLAQNGMIISGGGFSPLGSGLIRSMLELNLLSPYIQKLRDTFRHRAHVLADALDDLRPLGIQFQRPRGGYFIWVTLPESLNSDDLLTTALERGVRFQPGNLFSPDGTQGNNLRLCFAFYEEDDLREGVQRLGQAIRAMRRL
ncbi:PLP-dependent aminotransferase family protein [Deinococcus fonticola]|uniref:aminotransferase-like domain-containing protein n=1 Tax=Deinococcus fonticola TaxID=2528713 RepID=UPI001074CF16|nr:PLP-dependent aminotransferase family protein [Deinococcus fonticola]